MQGVFATRIDIVILGMEGISLPFAHNLPSPSLTTRGSSPGQWPLLERGPSAPPQKSYQTFANISASE